VYPRPQLVREGAEFLEGFWDFAVDAAGRISNPDDVRFDAKIVVPFSPETKASGIQDTGFYKAVWYRRVIQRPALAPGERLLVHFGAVDQSATVWVNGAFAARHVGGYTPFTVDTTPYLRDGVEQEIVVRAEDDPHDLTRPRGKQDWKLHPHSIWYPRTTGIWQTVWMEKVPSTYLQLIRWTPNLERWEIGLKVWCQGEMTDGAALSVKFHVGEQVLASDTYRIIAGELHRRVAFSDPGIDDFRNELLWSPGSPTLIDVDMKLWADRGELIDSVRSYTALRAIDVEADRFILNGRPYPLRLVLDQGYWDDSGMTAPTPESFAADIQLVKAMGFNGVRKHQKVEDPRYLAWADRLGLLVWEEMPSAYRFTQRSVRRVTQEWMEVLYRDYSHPCIVAWVPFNESWGVPNLPDNPAERHYVQALYHLTKTIDPTRPVVGNDGWEAVATDIIGIHDYDDDPERLVKRYQAEEVLPRLLRKERPGGRQLVLGEHKDQPIVLSEFGGIAYSKGEADTWGYSRAGSARDLGERYARLLGAVRSLGVLAGFCYTQFADTYQESNGLLFSDRTPKIPIEDIAAATAGIPRRRSEDAPKPAPRTETAARDIAPGGPVDDAEPVTR
jgi:beta-galactosidase/beta-glucuronidase